MAIFEGQVLRQTVAVAEKRKIEPAALLAVVEVESAGKALEVDGKTPCLLFERHVFYRELKNTGKLSRLRDAVAAGLANSSWQPKTQYKDQGSSAGRLALFAKARAIDEMAAIRSCSWGVGQTMGFNAEEIHFHDAKVMWDYMVQGGIPAQVECMVREIENKNLVAKLNLHNWAGFAAKYNGASYRVNKYDIRMATAYMKWRTSKLPVDTVAAPVNVSPALEPKSQPMIAPAKTESKVGVGAGIAAFFAGIWATLSSLEVRYVAFTIFLVALTIVTVVVVRYRRNIGQFTPLGNLSLEDKGA